MIFKHRSLGSALFCFSVGISVGYGSLVSASVVDFSETQLLLDGQPQPQLFGAELQYFRLRGGLARNVPRERVREVWGRAFDHMKDAGMNTLSFYIPWDFHEYKDGHFDFDGRVDEDGDGQPDFPSRDVNGFIEMALAKGIHHIMVRPGPYINAEWGFLGFGAIPLWFHEKYPESHMQNSRGQRTMLYDYFSPDLRRHTQKWFAQVHQQVLRGRIGAGKPIHFVQIDNETNFMWQSLYNHDFGPRAKARYRQFLQTRYENLTKVNTAHQRHWKTWAEIEPPAQPYLNIAEDQDWFRFSDDSMFEYLKFVRRTWEDLGLREPEVLFTLAESYNAPRNGVLPNYVHRNSRETGLMTVNLYPKTYELPSSPLHNSPFKSDHDVKAADAANDTYFGRKVEWVMGPEIQGGWWQGTPVLPASRKQTYLSTIGHGMKALLIYYFSEGQNWQNDWLVSQVLPIYNELKLKPEYSQADPLPEIFWHELQGLSDDRIFAGLPTRYLMEHGPHMKSELYFDSPLDKDANPRPHFSVLRDLGNNLIKPYGELLAKAVELEDEVCLLKDSRTQVPGVTQDLDSPLIHGEWAAGLVGWLESAGVNPRIHHWDLMAPSLLTSCRVIFHQDNGVVTPGLAVALIGLANEGKTVINVFSSQLTQAMGVPLTTEPALIGEGLVDVTHEGQQISVPGRPLSFVLTADPKCRSLATVQSRDVGVRCEFGAGQVIQLGFAPHALFNSSGYNDMWDLQPRLTLLRNLLGPLESHLRLSSPRQVAAFARRADDQTMITVKNGSRDRADFQLSLPRLNPLANYRVRDLYSQNEHTLTGAVLQFVGFSGALEGFDSTVYLVSEL